MVIPWGTERTFFKKSQEEGNKIENKAPFSHFLELTLISGEMFSGNTETRKGLGWRGWGSHGVCGFWRGGFADGWLLLVLVVTWRDCENYMRGQRREPWCLLGSLDHIEWSRYRHIGSNRGQQDPWSLVKALVGERTWSMIKSVFLHSKCIGKI